MILGWSEPKFTKTWVTPASHRASKKANDVVYMLGSVGSVDARRLWDLTISRGEVVVPLSSGRIGVW